MCLCFQMPRIWLDYCQFMMDQCRLTRTRHTFDRALRALPITQHRCIWPLYLKFVKAYSIPETAVRVYRRYLKVRLSRTLVCCFSTAVRPNPSSPALSIFKFKKVTCPILVTIQLNGALVCFFLLSCSLIYAITVCS